MATVLRLAFVFVATANIALSITFGITTDSHNQHMISYSSAFWPFTQAHSNVKRLTEADYQQAAAMKSDGVMIEFVVNMLKEENKIVLNNGELAGFVQWYSGTKAVQTLELLKEELAAKKWVQTAPKALRFSAQAGHQDTWMSEEDYQEVAALKSDEAMIGFVVRMLDRENKVVTNFGELAGLVQWFSGTKSVQTLAQLRQELSAKEWVQPADVAFLANAETIGKPMDNSSTKAAHVEKHEKMKRKDSCYECVISADSEVVAYPKAGRPHLHNHDQMFVSKRKSSLGLKVAEPGTYWLLHTRNIQIQGAFWKANASSMVLGGLAVSGGFMGGNTLMVRSWKGMQWNKEQIMSNQSYFSNKFVHTSFKRHANKKRLSKDQYGNTIASGVRILFANGMSMMVGVYAGGLTASIHMCAAVKPVQLEGHCVSGMHFGQRATAVRQRSPHHVLPQSKPVDIRDNLFVH